MQTAKFLITVVALLSGLPCLPVCAQDAPDGAGASAPAEPDMRQLYRGLFTPQPQYPTPGVTIMNPDPIPAKTDDPVRHLFAPQPQYPTPGSTVMNAEPQSSSGDNPMKGFFQTQPQYPAPGKTLMNPEWAPSVLQKSDDPTAHVHTLDASANPKELPAQYKHDNPASIMRAGPPPGVVDNPEAFPHVYGAGEHPQIGEHRFTPETHPREVPHILDASASPRNGQGDKFWESLPPLPAKAPPAAAAKTPAKQAPAAKPKAKPEKKKKPDKKDKKKDSKQNSAKGQESKDKDQGKSASAANKADSPEKNPTKEPAAKLQPPPPAVAESALKSVVSYLNARNYDKSLQTVNEILSRSPNDAEAHYLRGVVLVMKRQYQDAAAEYRRVQGLCPESPVARRAAEGLKKIGL